MSGGRKEIAIPLRVWKEQTKSSIPADVASAFNIASFNAGAALGAYAGGLVVSSVFGLQAAPLAAAIFMVISIIMVLISTRIEKKQ